MAAAGRAAPQAGGVGSAGSRREHRLGPFWRADEVLTAVDAFAERAGRREE
ncbi:hypothetical protein [Ruania halotolerans]|uniref:hypothetical protein n=1 Tax=Ruania halotolerans TaxID=2897773 RepID=UPI001E571C93|nr:hypothetical protein [Ruania halotolerans]UFU05633.1 hypothetical protein LQF10_14460 [Ruania halotolerans]